MLVWEEIKDAITGEVTRRQIEVPDVVTVEEGLILTAAEAVKAVNGQTLLTQADQALVNLRAYRDLQQPTNAQTIAAVKLLCRVAIGLIRMKLAKFDGTD